MEAGGFDALEVDGGRPARGRLLRAPARGHGPAAVRRRAPRASVLQPRRAVRRRPRPRRARRRARAPDVRRAGRAPACTRGDPRERELLWAAAHAARHRHGGRLRRPPQALALPDPQRRPARLLAARDRAHRARWPATTARARRRSASSRRSRGRATTTLLERGVGGPAAGRAARARPRPERRGARVDVQDGAVALRLEGDGDVPVARWAAQRETDLFERAFGKALAVGR